MFRSHVVKFGKKVAKLSQYKIAKFAKKDVTIGQISLKAVGVGLKVFVGVFRIYMCRGG